MTGGASKGVKVASNGVATRWTGRVVLGALCALVIGVYAWSAHSGVLELLGSGPQDSYYNLQVRGFRNGHLNVEREPPAGLAQPGAPANLGWADSVSAGLADLSYYNGKLYLYFGVTPTLVLFWPYVALTGHYLSHKDAVVVFLSVGFLAGAGLLCAVRRRYFKEAGLGVMVAGTLALGLANLAPTILARSDVYEVPISCGYALTLLALAGVWGALQDARRRSLWLAAASLAYGLAVGARPSLLFGAVILLVPAAQAWREKRSAWPLLLAAGGPILLIGLGILVYNALRFGNPLEFGQRYQLPFTSHQQFSPRYLWFNFQVGFLDPAGWSGHFPFVRDIAPPAPPRGYWHADYPFGVLTSIPLVWLALAAPLAWRSRSVEARSILRWFVGAVALLFGAAALILCLHDSMALRYELEYASPLSFLAVIGLLALERALAGQPVWRWAARCGCGMLLAVSAAFNLFARFELQADTHNLFGNALLQKGKVEDAISQYQMALQSKPDHADAHNNLGAALLQKGRLDEAIAQFQQAAQLNPRLAAAYYDLGNALQQKGGLDEAISQYQKALQIKPDYAHAHNNLGTALLQKGRGDDAISQYQMALQIEPDYAEAHDNLGAAFARMGRVEEAIAQFQKALQIEPDYAEAHDHLGSALVRMGRVEEAIAQFQKALQIKPDYADAHNNLGAALLQQGAVDQAIAHFQAALQFQPDLEDAHYNLGVALSGKGNLEEAIAQFRRALEMKPDDWEALLKLGDALLNSGKLEEAIVSYQRAIKINPRSADTYSGLGTAFFKKGEIQKTLDSWQQALQTKPDQIYVLNNLAWLLATTPDAALRNGAKAVALAAQADQLSGGGNPMMLRTLAAAYAEVGSYTLAAATARRGLDLALGQKNDTLAATLQKEIKLYEADTPVRDAPR
ncbi:MAG: tetratricopeptide repeat protein [Verrucomicrobiota bacterium]|jgi:tetratricopeptide (TPR) repeat protein